MRYRLDIYTWPAMMGVNPKIRASWHESPQNAIGLLNAEKQPYAYAVLLAEAERGVLQPCDWDGRPVGSSKWPYRQGTNGIHPDVISLKRDWQNLIAIVRSQYDGKRGTLEIANEVLHQYHPNVYGYAHPLGWAAAEK